MWRCLKFYESFKSGRGILNKDQVVVFLRKLLESAAVLKIDRDNYLPKITDEKEFILFEELNEQLENQNLFRKIFVPSLASPNSEFNLQISGVMFVEVDDMLLPFLNYICKENKKIIQNVPVHENDVKKIINAIQIKDQVRGLQVGDVVEITNGPYKEVIGRIRAVHTNNLVDVIISIFNTEQTISLAVDQIKFIEDSVSIKSN